MQNIDLIALLLTIIVILIAIWFFRKVLILVAILIVVAVLAYIFLQNNPNSGQFHRQWPQQKAQTHLLESFKDNYCSILYDRDDSLLCLDIVEPIYNDIVKNYDLDSVETLNKQQFINLIIEVARRNKGRILRNLERDNALYLWKDFVADIKDFNIF